VGLSASQHILRGKNEKGVMVSHHEMMGAQRKDLERIMGSEVDLIVWNETVRSAEKLTRSIEAVDAVAVVRPPELLEDVLEIPGEKLVLRGSSRQTVYRTSHGASRRQARG